MDNDNVKSGSAGTAVEEKEHTSAEGQSGESSAESGKPGQEKEAPAAESADAAKKKGRRGRKRDPDPEDDVPYEKRRRPWTKDRVLALILQIVIVLFLIGGIVFYRWYNAKHEQYKTGVMTDGNLCVAYISSDSGARQSFVLKGSAVEEQSRFAFSEFYYTRLGRIYKPVQEGTAELTTMYIDKQGNEVHERFEITVDSSLNITYTVEAAGKEDKRDAEST